MRAFLTSILCSVTAILFAGCQSQTYKLIGTAEGLADGDMLLLTDNMNDGTPTDTIILKGNTFSFTGEIEKDKEATLCMVYSAKHNEINAPFIREAGEITINLSATPGASRVSGTPCNNEWQRLNDSVMVIGREINRIAEHIYGNTVSQEKQQRGMEQIEKLNKRFSEVVIDVAEKNIDNEFGYFVVTNLAPNLGLDQVTALIGKMPAKFRQRDEVKELEAMLQQANNDDQEQQIEDFTMATPEGTELSVMDEVEQHELTILDFWASWCQPCVREMPNMVALYDAYHDKGLGIIGISLDEDHEQWTKAIKSLGLKWPQISDLKGWNSYAAEMFHVQAIPHMIVVDKNGAILQRGLRGEELSSFIARQLDEKAAE